ncbi:tetratricopeptide repeat protein [Paenibacillus thermotolerans]|uniref:tetratricopeptide repeat protein n=1 Tax=Paenibacillus thermotolerans TaxID=3027807 RepID=UPI0023686B0F|nr:MULTISPECIES: tetratricopeptide repeat protein [unclassified Paenibacillus]
MFKQLFQSMNEALDLIVEAYPASEGSERNALFEQLEMLRTMSDGIIEEWLLFEEKMAQANLSPGFAGQTPAVPSAFADLDLAAVASEANASGMQHHHLKQSESFRRGEGYFKLLMFHEAIREFQKVIDLHPEFLLPRLYMALGLLQTERIAEAYGHLQVLVSLADDEKLMAVAYNAMGCVQALSGNVEKACELFKKSHKMDPQLQDPVYNLKACLTDGGVLQLGVAIG